MPSDGAREQPATGKRPRGRPRKYPRPGEQVLAQGIRADGILTASEDDDGDEYMPPLAFQPEPIINPLRMLATGASVLSKTEVDIIRPILIEAVKGYSEYAEKVMSETNRARTVISPENNNLIWSDLEPDEIETLVDGLLIIGQRQKHVAVAIREIARTWHAIQAGLILFPRFLKTVQFYSENGGIALW